jgi:hypothetical protein
MAIAKTAGSEASRPKVDGADVNGIAPLLNVFKDHQSNVG